MGSLCEHNIRAERNTNQPSESDDVQDSAIFIASSDLPAASPSYAGGSARKGLASLISDSTVFRRLARARLGLSSTPMARSPKKFATASTVPVPQKGSTTTA
eukprot:EG_transcript_61617